MKTIVTIILASGFGLFIYWHCRDPVNQNTSIKKHAHVTSPHVLKSGDLIFQTSKSSQSKAIQLATNSRYSHMGIVYEMRGQFYVYEAVQPVKLTKLADWITRGEESHYVVKRLKK